MKKLNHRFKKGLAFFLPLPWWLELYRLYPVGAMKCRQP